MNTATTTTVSNAVKITPRLIVGFAVLCFGLLWTLDNMNVMESEAIAQWWPAVLIVVGAVRLLDPAASRFASIALMLIGTLLVLDVADLVDFDLGDLIPLAVAALGAKLIWDALGRRSVRRAAGTDPNSVISAFALMGGVSRRSSAAAFQGGEASAIMGGIELDLRNATIRDGDEAVIDTLAWWGGVEIKVPADWRVVGKVMPLMGSFEDKTHSTSTTGPVLVVRGVAVMGSVEVRN